MATPSLLERMVAAGLRPLLRGGRRLLPLLQGGMGVGISAYCLAGVVVSPGAWGTIAFVALRRHYADLPARSAGISDGDARKKDVINQANQEALAREIRKAREIAGGRGLVAVNVIRAVSEYAAYGRTALQEGVDALVVRAGLPLDLPELAKDYPYTALVPILPEARGVALLWRKWERRKRFPSAIVIEHPAHAGGHLGAARVADLCDPGCSFETVLPAVRQQIREAGVEGQVALIAAGGVRRCVDIQRMQPLGADAAQLGTAFATTEECDADPGFKQVLAQACDEDQVEFTSVAGLPARAVPMPWLSKYLKSEVKLQSVAQLKQRCTMAFDCLSQSGLRDGFMDWGQFCIDQRLAAALRGDVSKGLFFRGLGELPFGAQIASVRQLLERLLTPGIALGTPA